MQMLAYLIFLFVRLNSISSAETKRAYLDSGDHKSNFPVITPHMASTQDSIYSHLMNIVDSFSAKKEPLKGAVKPVRVNAPSGMSSQSSNTSNMSQGMAAQSSGITANISQDVITGSSLSIPTPFNSQNRTTKGKGRNRHKKIRTTPISSLESLIPVDGNKTMAQNLPKGKQNSGTTKQSSSQMNVLSKTPAKLPQETASSENQKMTSMPLTDVEKPQFQTSLAQVTPTASVVKVSTEFVSPNMAKPQTSDLTPTKTAHVKSTTGNEPFAQSSGPTTVKSFPIISGTLPVPVDTKKDTSSILKSEAQTGSSFMIGTGGLPKTSLIPSVSFNTVNPGFSTSVLPISGNPLTPGTMRVTTALPTPNFPTSSTSAISKLPISNNPLTPTTLTTSEAASEVRTIPSMIKTSSSI
jgi:hypothetical protein